jgi:predicted nucleic acid-binding protein
MEPVLVDSSVWIDFFNGKSTVQARFLHNLLHENERVCVCPPILQEVLQGLERRDYYNRVLGDLMMLEILICEPVMAAGKAADLYILLRQKGITIRKSNDCLIAYHAIHFGAKVLHVDRDFSLMVKHTALKVC